MKNSAFSIENMNNFRAEGKPQAPALAFNPFVLTTAYFEPGHADEFLNGMEPGDRKTVCEIELLFYRGKAAQAYRLCRQLKAGKDPSVRVGAFLMSMLSCLTVGNDREIQESYRMLEYLTGLAATPPRLKTAGEFFNLYFNIILHNTDAIRLPSVNVEAFAVEQELKPMAIHTYSHYLVLCNDIGRAIGLSEGALIFMKKTCPVSEIYLALIISVGYVMRGMWEKAEYYFRYAWDLAEPDGLIFPFAEYRGLLSGLLEKCLRYEYPDKYKEIMELSNIYHKNWTRIHNLVTGDTLSDKLSAVELNIALLASREFSNTEIAEFLGISVNSVRAHLRNIFNKLAIDSRKKLRAYVIK